MEQQCLAVQDLNPSNVSREQSRTVSLQHGYRKSSSKAADVLYIYPSVHILAKDL